MRSDIEDIVEKILSLPPTARASLAELLRESLDHEEDFPVPQEWADEIERRCREMDDGQVQPIPAEDTLISLHERYA